MSQTRRVFRIDDIPLSLFEEICHKLGVGEEERVGEGADGNCSLRVRALNADHPAVSFKAIVLVRVVGGISSFQLHSESIDLEEPLLEVLSGERSGEAQSFGNLNLGAIKLHENGVGLNEPHAKLVSFIVFRALQMAQGSSDTVVHYWEAGSGFVERDDS